MKITLDNNSDYNKYNISVLIINYNLSKDLFKLITNILSATNETVEVLVFDNNSIDIFRNLLKNVSHPRFTYVYSDQNLGYGKATNLLAEKAQGEILALINPDVKISDPFVFFNSISSIYEKYYGILGPKIFYPNGTVQHSFYLKYSTYKTFIPNLFNLGEYYSKIQSTKFGMVANFFASLLLGDAANEYINRGLSSNQTRKCAWISGAALFLNRSLFIKVNGFDDQFFLYSEDEDLCRRVNNLGYDISYYPSLSVIHVGGGTQENSQQRFFISTSKAHRICSAYLYLTKYNSKLDQKLYKFFVLLRICINFEIIKNKKNTAKILFRLFN